MSNEGFYGYITGISVAWTSMTLIETPRDASMVYLQDAVGEQGDFYMTDLNGIRLGFMYTPCYQPIPMKNWENVTKTSFSVQNGLLFTYLVLNQEQVSTFPAYSWYCLNPCPSCPVGQVLETPVGVIVYNDGAYVTATNGTASQSMVQFITEAGETVSWETAICSDGNRTFVYVYLIFAYTTVLIVRYFL